MKRETELALARDILQLAVERRPFLKPDTRQVPVNAYFDQQRFVREREKLFVQQPHMLAHSSELPGSASFLRRELCGVPILLTRDNDGVAHAFLNVCRHRGMRLVSEEQGCKQRFSCPYHAWTWNNRGDLLSIPHRSAGFPEIDDNDVGLVRLGCIERHGWLWVTPQANSESRLPESSSTLLDEFDAVDMAGHRIVHSDVQLRDANWKIIVEGGLEAYHFRVAHRATIGAYFHENLSTFETLGPHLRSVLARHTLPELARMPEDEWRLRDHAQILYNVFPSTSVLVQADHFAWIAIDPVSASRSRLRICTMAPADRLEDPRDVAHWAKNHRITIDTLNEDFDIAEGIQAGLDSGANAYLRFGRFEGALAAFKDIVEARM